MAIPEHEKCVRRNKLFSHYKKKGYWRAARAKRRKEGKLKLKKRIRAIIDVELAMQRVNTLKTFKSCKNWTKFMEMMVGKHYRRWGEVRMNNRTRQWFKAIDMISRFDPLIACVYDTPGTVALGITVIRRSQFEEAKKKYGETLRVLMDNEI